MRDAPCRYMREKKIPPRKRVDRIGTEDRAGVARKGSADINVDKREKDVERK